MCFKFNLCMNQAPRACQHQVLVAMATTLECCRTVKPDKDMHQYVNEALESVFVRLKRDPDAFRTFVKVTVPPYHCWFRGR